MTDRIQAGGLQVATSLHRFIAEEALPAAGTGLDETAFWAGVAEIFADLTPVNRRLLRRRDDLQAAIDSWHLANAGQPLARVASRRPPSQSRPGPSIHRWISAGPWIQSSCGGIAETASSRSRATSESMS